MKLRIFVVLVLVSVFALPELGAGDGPGQSPGTQASFGARQLFEMLAPELAAESQLRFPAPNAKSEIRVIELLATDSNGVPAEGAMAILSLVGGESIQETVDQNGRAAFSLSSLSKLKSIGVVKPGVGFDFRQFLDRDFPYDSSVNAPLPQNVSEAIQLTLVPVQPRKVKCLGPDGQPLAGVKLNAGFFYLSDRSGIWDIQGLPFNSLTTDSKGEAVCEMLGSAPGSHVYLSVQSPREDWGLLSSGLVLSGADTTGAPHVLQLEQLVEVKGTVQEPLGDLIAGVEIRAQSFDPEAPIMFQSKPSDGAGRWKLFVSPNRKYQLSAFSSRWDLGMARDLRVEADSPKGPLDLYLVRKCWVSGTVKGQFSQNDIITVRRHGTRASGRRGIQTVAYVSSTALHGSKTCLLSADGTFNCDLTPGIYSMGEDGGESQVVVVPDQLEAKIELRLDLTPSTPVVFHVIDGETGKDSGGAFVEELRFPLFGIPRIKLTGADGVCTMAEKHLRGQTYRVIGQDRKLALVRLAKLRSRIEVVLKPPVRVRGRLVNSSGFPIRNQEIVCGLKCPDDSAMALFGGQTVTTDEFGRFEIADLCSEATYTLAFDDELEESDARRTILFSRFTTTEDDLDLGDVSLR